MSKIYLVTVQAKPETPATEYLVRAHTRAGVVAHVAETSIAARLPSQDELVRAATAGVSIIDATKE